jgi:hypothetical protein
MKSFSICLRLSGKENRENVGEVFQEVIIKNIPELMKIKSICK